MQETLDPELNLREFGMIFWCARSTHEQLATQLNPKTKTVLAKQFKSHESVLTVVTKQNIDHSQFP
jgi:hypothetical protein